MLTVENLSYRYTKNGATALEDLSFTLEEGRLSVLLGCNGAGKSTLIRLLASLYHPTSGNIHIDDRDLMTLKPKEKARLIAYVPQTPEINELTVFDNVLLGRLPYLSHRPSKEDLSVVAAILQDMGLEKLSKRRLTELSGGERQRVTIARALAQQPRVLLLDEPNSALDVRAQLKLFRLLKEQIVQHHLIALISLHSLNQAMQFGDDFLLLRKGRLLAQGNRDVITEDNLAKLYWVRPTIHDIDGQKVVLFNEKDL